MFNIKTKILSLILALLLLTAGMNVFAAWDGYVPPEIPEEERLTLKIVDMNNLSDILAAGAIPSREHTFSSKYSAHWYRHEATMNLNFYNIPADWSQVETIEIPIYSDKASNSKIGVYVYCRNSEGTGSGYKYTSFRVDWAGEKLLKLETKNLIKEGDADLSKAYRLRLTVDSNYSGTLKKDTSIYIGSITGKLIDHEGNAIEEQELLNSLSGSMAFIDYSIYMLSGDKFLFVDEDDQNALVNVLKGEKFLPLSFFEKHFSSLVSSENGKYIIKRGENTLEIAAGETSYKINGKEESFSVAPFYRKDILYVPAIKSVEAFGERIKAFGQVLVIGENLVSACEKNSDTVSKIEKRLGNYMPDAGMVTSEDFEEIRLKWRETLVGNENNDLTNPYVKAIVKNIEADADKCYKILNYGADRDKKFTLFGDTAITTTGHMGTQYKNLLALATAYGTKGTKYYKDEKIKNDIISGLDWLYENVYGEDEINGVGWRSIKAYNWYDWYKSVPQSLGHIFIIMKPEIGMENMRKYYSLYTFIKDTWRQDANTESAQSRVTGGLRYAVVMEDAKDIAARLKDIGTAIEPGQEGDGYREDYCYIYHTKYPYATMYGVNSFCQSLIPYINIFSGTKFQFTSENKNAIPEIFYNTYLPLLHNGRAMCMFSGRATLYDADINNGAKILKAMYLSIGMFGEEEDLKLKQYIRMNINDTNRSSVFALMSIGDVQGLSDILADESIPEIENYKDCKVYWAGDRVIQKRNGYTVGIALSSERIGNYESINTDGQMHWFTGDGALYVYNDGPLQFHADFKHMNYERIPGTTEDARSREAINVHSSQAYRPESDFVGGVQFDNEYATVAFDFIGFHNTRESTYVNKGHGGGLQVFESTLRAKKSWFLFDDEIVALGAGITANEDSDIRTYLDNRLLYKDTNEVLGTEDIVIDGETLEKANSYTKEFKNPLWAYVETEGGYYFPIGGTLTVNKRHPDTNYLEEWFIHSATRVPLGKSWLEMWFEHGKKPSNTSYAYVVLPNKSAEQTKAYSENPDISILANTSKIQAVKENNLNLTGIVFHEKGKFGTVSSDTPLVVMTLEKENEYIIKMSDPTHKLTKATVTVNRDISLVSCDDIISVKKNGQTTEITLDLSNKKGQTFTATFK